MGNDIAISENAKLGVKSAVDSEVLEPTIKGTDDLSLVHASKQSDGDDRFEEAIDADSPMIGSENSTTSSGESIASVSSLNNNESNSDVSYDVHEFEQVTEGAGAGLNAEVAVSKAELLMSEENDEEQEISSERMVQSETNRSVADGIDEDDKGDGGEPGDSAATTSETENLINEKKMLDESNQEPEDDILNKSRNLDRLTSEDGEIFASDGKEGQMLQVQKILEPSESVVGVTGSDKIEIERHKMTEIQDVSNVSNADTLSNIPDGFVDRVSLVASLHHEDGKSAEHEELKDHIHEVPLEIESTDDVGGSEANPRPESDSNGDVLHKNEQYATQGSGHLLDKHENISTSLFNSELKEDQIGEQVEQSSISRDILEDDKNIKLKKVNSECMQVEEDDSNYVDKEECSGIPSADASSAADHVKESSGFAANLHPVLDGRTLNLEAKGEPCSNPSEILTEQLANSRVEISTTVGNRREQEVLKNYHKEIYLPEIRGQEVRHVAVISSSSDRSSELDTAYPSSLDHAAKTLGPVSQDEEANTEQEIKHTADISSAKSVTPRPVGLRHAVPLSKPASQNKEEGSKPAADIPSDNVISTASVHPSSLDCAAKAQEPVSQDAITNTEQEVKHTADSSSAKSVSPHPVGLRHTVPLPEPASRKGSNSVADIPSNSVSSAASTHPAGLGRAPLLESTTRVVQVPRVNGAVSAAQNQLIEDPTNGETEEYDETREKLQMIRVKFLRLAHRLGQTPHNVVVAQVLYRLGLAEQLHGRSGGRVAAFSFDRASALAEQLEAAGQEPLDFTCTIMVLGKSGVGKSATINSIFDEIMFSTDAFQSGTKKVQDIVGTVQGIRVRVIDTPGLLPSWSDQRQNEKILQSVKRFIKKTPPDIVLYLDRLDMQSRDFGDLPLLRTITGIFGPSIWFNAIVVLTHAASAPPEGPNGTSTSYDMFVTQRSQAVQQAIRQAAGDMRLMNPVSLVENHSACRTNRAGQRVLPNGQIWKPHLLLLSFASKILAEANTLLKLQDTPPGRPFTPRTRSPPLPFLLPSLLQSRPEVKLPSEQFGGDDDDAIDDDMDEGSDSEEESDYDELPPFKSLTKAQLEKLTKAQRKGYYDELEYREKLFLKKQLKEERKRRKMMKKLQEESEASPADYSDNGEEDTSGAASVPVPMPDLVLPASFDSDNPTHRYRSLDSSNPWLVRAVQEPNGWDHDIGYDGVTVERLFVVKDKVPISFSGQITKDKKDTNLQMEIASSVTHGNGKATSLGFDMQSVGKDYAYTLRTETRFSNRRINKAAAGISATVMGDVLTGGIKLEDKLIIGKRGQVVVSGGAIYGRGEVAYGGSLEATLRDKDHPFGRFLSTLGLSVMDWHGDLAIGCNTQTQIPIGRYTNLIGRLNVNNRGSGQFSIRINSSEQLQIVLVGLIPLVKKVLGYSQQVEHGW